MTTATWTSSGSATTTFLRTPVWSSSASATGDFRAVPDGDIRVGKAEVLVASSGGGVRVGKVDGLVVDGSGSVRVGKVEGLVVHSANNTLTSRGKARTSWNMSKARHAARYFDERSDAWIIVDSRDQSLTLNSPDLGTYIDESAQGRGRVTDPLTGEGLGFHRYVRYWSLKGCNFTLNAQGKLAPPVHNYLLDSDDVSNEVEVWDFGAGSYTVAQTGATTPAGEASWNFSKTGTANGQRGSAKDIGDHRFDQQWNAGERFRITCDAREAGTEFLQLGYYNADGVSSQTYANYDLNLGTVTDTGTDTSIVASITEIENGWYHCVFEAETTTTDSPGIYHSLPENGTAARTASWTGNADIDIWRFSHHHAAAPDEHLKVTVNTRGQFVYLSPIEHDDCGNVLGARFSHGGELLAATHGSNINFASVAWTKHRSSVEVDGYGPFVPYMNEECATKITWDGTDGAFGVERTVNNSISGFYYGVALVRKQYGVDWVYIEIVWPLETSRAWFNLATGEVGSISGSYITSLGMRHLGDGWYKVYINGSNDGAIDAPEVGIYGAYEDAQASPPLWVGSAQFELAHFAVNRHAANRNANIQEPAVWPIWDSSGDQRPDTAHYIRVFWDDARAGTVLEEDLAAGVSRIFSQDERTFDTGTFLTYQRNATGAVDLPAAQVRAEGSNDGGNRNGIWAWQETNFAPDTRVWGVYWDDVLSDSFYHSSVPSDWQIHFEASAGHTNLAQKGVIAYDQDAGSEEVIFGINGRVGAYDNDASYTRPTNDPYTIIIGPNGHNQGLGYLELGEVDFYQVGWSNKTIAKADIDDLAQGGWALEARSFTHKSTSSFRSGQEATWSPAGTATVDFRKVVAEADWTSTGSATTAWTLTPPVTAVWTVVDCGVTENSAAELTVLDNVNEERVTLNSDYANCTTVTWGGQEASGSIETGDWTSTGVATVTWDGEEIREGDWTSTASATTTWDGEEIRSGDWTSTGSATTSWDGQAVREGDWTSTGVATTSWDAQSFAEGDLSSTGVATVSWEGAQATLADFTILAAATVTMDGEATTEADWSSAGVATVAFDSEATVESSYAITGAATVAWDGEEVREGDWTVTAAATASPVGAADVEVDWTSDGAATVTWPALSSIATVALSAGSASVAFFAAATQDADWSSTAAATVTWDGDEIRTGDWASTGAATTSWDAEATGEADWAVTGVATASWGGEQTTDAIWSTTAAATAAWVGRTIWSSTASATTTWEGQDASTFQEADWTSTASATTTWDAATSAGATWAVTGAASVTWRHDTVLTVSAVASTALSGQSSVAADWAAPGVSTTSWGGATIESGTLAITGVSTVSWTGARQVEWSVIAAAAVSFGASAEQISVWSSEGSSSATWRGEGGIFLGSIEWIRAKHNQRHVNRRAHYLRRAS